MDSLRLLHIKCIFMTPSISSSFANVRPSVFKRLIICYGVSTVNISELLKWFAARLLPSFRSNRR